MDSNLAPRLTSSPPTAHDGAVSGIGTLPAAAGQSIALPILTVAQASFLAVCNAYPLQALVIATEGALDVGRVGVDDLFPCVRRFGSNFL